MSVFEYHGCVAHVDYNSKLVHDQLLMGAYYGIVSGAVRQLWVKMLTYDVALGVP